ncbi:MAG: hypothetical protein A3E78_11800 [Alphaproteobacteria bacterium RIFCSPHIGHO2_12_FULL_63_12]|nr:MAG: hypothetical protein A3E78_11800 [Alphaproteobacteria bacterium RIFCSPHIGHO2_12_FULL_63_12]
MTGQSTSIRVEKLKEPAECVKCGWAMDPGEPAVLDGGLIFCSARCQRLAVSDPHQFDLGGES